MNKVLRQDKHNRYVTGCPIYTRWGECRLKKCRVKGCWLKKKMAKLSYNGFLRMVFPEGLPTAKKDALRRRGKNGFMEQEHDVVY